MFPQNTLFLYKSPDANRNVCCKEVRLIHGEKPILNIKQLSFLSTGYLLSFLPCIIFRFTILSVEMYYGACNH